MNDTVHVEWRNSMKAKLAFLEGQIYLRDVELFQDLTADEIDALAERMPIQVVDAGTVFYTPQEPTEILFLLKKGRVRLYYLSAEGKAFTTAILEAGTFFGEMTLLGQALYDSYAEAITPCMLCLMSRDDVRTLLLGDRRIAFRIVEMLGRRLVESQHRLADFVLKSVSARLASLLLQLAHKQKSRQQKVDLTSTGFVEVACTHEELAQMIGTQRETTTRTLKELRGQGLIELHRGRIMLLNMDGLQKLSAD